MSAKQDAVVSAASAVANAAGSVASTANDILKTYLIKALDKTGNLVDKAVDMVQEQAPILVHEVLQWYFAYNLIMFIIGLALVIGVFVMNYKHYKFCAAQQKLDYKDRSPFYTEEGWEIGRFFGTIIFTAVPLVVALFILNLDWLKIWIAPRLWLIEYTAQLVKSHT
jgi:hypothetical protein